MVQTDRKTNVHVDVENIKGSSSNDLLVRSDADNVFTGSQGTDKMDGRGGNDTFIEFNGESGADDMIGGSGSDTLDLQRLGSDITVTLDNAANDGVDESDNVHSDVETVLTGSGNDTLIGNSANNVLRSAAGRDILYGGAGNDVLDGGQDGPVGQMDWLSGGPGVDTVTLLDALQSCHRADRRCP